VVPQSSDVLTELHLVPVLLPIQSGLELKLVRLANALVDERADVMRCELAGRGPKKVCEA
jgi:hypothetical protein